MRFVVLLALVFVTCTPPVLVPSATPTAIVTAAATTAPDSTIAAAPSPKVPGAPQRSVVTFYRTDDVLRGPAQPSKRLDISVPVYDMQFGPDPRWAIISNVGERAPLRLLDLENGDVVTVPLSLTSDALNYRSLVRWLPDGRLLLTGREIWVGGSRGEDVRSVFARFPFEVVPSHSGKLLAILPLGSTAIVVLDLASGNTSIVPGPFRPCVQDGGVGIVWAPDDRAIAATDCSDQAQGGMQTRFASVADGREIRSLADLSVSAWLPGGDVVARGPFRPRADAEVWVISVNGARRAIPPVGFLISPDGRFLLGSVIRDAPTSSDPARREDFAQLVDVLTGRVIDVGEGRPTGWTDQGEIALITLF